MKRAPEYDEKGRPKRRASSVKVNYQAMMLSEDDELECTGRLSQKQDQELMDWVNAMMVKEEENNNNNE